MATQLPATTITDRTAGSASLRLVERLNLASATLLPRLTPRMHMDLQPILRGELLELRPLLLEDFEPLFAAAADPLIWEQHPESDRYTRPVFQRYFDTAMESKGAFAIVERSSGRIIGSSRYWNFKPNESEIEIGWTFLERKFWGGKYNRELKSLMLDHAFRSVEHVVFVVGENNLRSQKAVKKIGAAFLRREERPGADGTARANVVFVLHKPRS